jgi:nitrogenase subunit NifH
MNRYTKQEQIERVNRQLQCHLAANEVKDKLLAEGFRYSVSLYGVIYNPETKKNEYRRIEVFMDKLPNRFSIEAIRNFFSEFKPYMYYTIWAYNSQLKEIVMVEGWQ